jgi:ATP-binding protein involved in chromosome partitioning
MPESKAPQESEVTEQQVLDALSQVIEPELHRDLVTLNMIKDVKIEGGVVSFTINLTTPACPMRKQMEERSRAAVLAVPGVREVRVDFDATVPTHKLITRLDIGVKNCVAVASGKGGVGKSTVAVNLAVALGRSGARIGLMDADIHGPNIPLMMGVHDQPRSRENRIIPLKSYGVSLMSMGFLVEPGTPLIWRGPMIHGIIRQFITEVDWDDLDYLLVDLPPGTGDAQISLAQSLPLAGVVIVTTPQEVALADVVKGINMFHEMDTPILGVVENMSYFVCPHCGERTDIFSHGGGHQVAERMGVPFLGEVPLDPHIRSGGDEGKPIVVLAPDSPAAQAFCDIAGKIAAAISVHNLAGE